MNDQIFTGERFIPGQGGFQIAYEHLHRYLFAARCAGDAVALDVATGAGYGAAILAQSARLVYAMDLDEGAIKSARATVHEGNVRFLRGDAMRLPVKTGSIELVIATEVLEHVADPEGMVRELGRVMHPEGAVLVSTPDRAAYSDARGYSNPFHVREFYEDEFVALLSRHFAHVSLMKQQIRAGSQINLCESGTTSACEILSEPPPDPQRAQTRPLYLMALCGNRLDRYRLPAVSAYLDQTDAYLCEWLQRLEDANAEIARINTVAEELGHWGRKQDEEVGKRDQEIGRLGSEIDRLGQIVHSLQRELEQEIAVRDKALNDLRAEFDERGQWARSLEHEIATRDARIVEAVALLDRRDAEIKQLDAQLSRIRHHFFYRVLCRLRLLPK